MVFYYLEQLTGCLFHIVVGGTRTSDIDGIELRLNVTIMECSEYGVLVARLGFPVNNKIRDAWVGLRCYILVFFRTFPVGAH